MGNVQMEARQIRYGSTNVEAALNNGGGGGGSSTLAALTDTAIENPTNGQVLEYDAATEKWINANASGGGSEIYSPTEVKIGKWGDDDLYRVVINATMNINDATDYNLNLPSGAVVKKWSAYYLVRNNPVNLPYYASSSEYCAPYIDSSNNHFKVMKASSANNAKVTIIVEYIKTSSR